MAFGSFNKRRMTALHQITRQAVGLFRLQLPTSVLSAALYDPAGLQQTKADRILAAYDPDMLGEFLARPDFQFLDELHRCSACVLRGYDGLVIVANRPQNSGTTLAAFTDRRKHRGAFTPATPTATSAAFSKSGRAAV